jgi:arylsulfatase A-like enzyme
LSQTPPEGPPNVVVVLLDGPGFAQFGCYGPDIATPAIDRLAAGGLRYHRFHVTALCSPTRAALLTGRNHHAVGMGFLADLPTSHPGYGARIPQSAATLPLLLRDAGWSTLAVGNGIWSRAASAPMPDLSSSARRLERLGGRGGNGSAMRKCWARVWLTTLS